LAAPETNVACAVHDKVVDVKKHFLLVKAPKNGRPLAGK
jgi:hypothetical protein